VFVSLRTGKIDTGSIKRIAMHWRLATVTFTTKKTKILKTGWPYPGLLIGLA
jgi:hypothetical protein